MFIGCDSIYICITQTIITWQGIYSFNNTSFDLSIVAGLPNIENYVYISQIKVNGMVADDANTKNEGHNLSTTLSDVNGQNRPRKRVLFCIASQVAVTVVKKNKRNF